MHDCEIAIIVRFLCGRTDDGSRLCVRLWSLLHVCVFMPVTDGARGPGQSQRRPDLHRYRPSPVYHSELWHYRRHVQGLCDRERNARPAHGPEGSLLQAGYHRGTDQLTAQEKQQPISKAAKRKECKGQRCRTSREARLGSMSWCVSK